jgi:hypothetical protein
MVTKLPGAFGLMANGLHNPLTFLVVLGLVLNTVSLLKVLWELGFLQRPLLDANA